MCLSVIVIPTQNAVFVILHCVRTHLFERNESAYNCSTRKLTTMLTTTLTTTTATTTTTVLYCTTVADAYG